MEPTKSQLIYKNACLSEGIENLQIENEELRVQNEALGLKVKHIKEAMGDLDFYYKAKLAEKDKEIEWLKEEKSMADNTSKNLTKKLKEKEDDFGYIQKISKELGLQNIDYEKQVAILKSSEKCLVENLKKANQDKIDYAVEQLNKIINIFEPYENEEKDTILPANNGVSFLEFINQIITEIKEGK